MGELRIKKDVLSKIIEHARREAPIEACGYLASQNDLIGKHYELKNIDESNEHFSFDPKEQFDTVKDARSNELDLCAVYHSHPETPARPSNEDIRLAYDPNVSYVIVSVASNEPVVNSYKITKLKEENSSLHQADTYDIQHDEMVVCLSEELKYLIQKEKLVTV